MLQDRSQSEVRGYVQRWESPLPKVELTAVHKHASLNLLNLLTSSSTVSLPGLCAPNHRIPRAYRQLTPCFQSTIPIELICALNIDRQYSSSYLTSSLAPGDLTPRFPLVRASSFQSFSLRVFSKDPMNIALFQGRSPHFHFRKNLFTTSCLLLRGLHSSILIPHLKDQRNTSVLTFQEVSKSALLPPHLSIVDPKTPAICLNSHFSRPRHVFNPEEPRYPCQKQGSFPFKIFCPCLPRVREFGCKNELDLDSLQVNLGIVALQSGSSFAFHNGLHGKHSPT